MQGIQRNNDLQRLRTDHVEMCETEVIDIGEKEHEELLKKANEIDKKLAERIEDSLKDEINTPEGRKKWLKGKKILFACCFCTKGMEKPERETAIRIEKTNQLYWCHTKCLFDKMTEQCRDEFQR